MLELPLQLLVFGRQIVDEFLELLNPLLFYQEALLHFALKPQLLLVFQNQLLDLFVVFLLADEVDLLRLELQVFVFQDFHAMLHVLPLRLQNVQFLFLSLVFHLQFFQGINHLVFLADVFLRELFVLPGNLLEESDFQFGSALFLVLQIRLLLDCGVLGLFVNGVREVAILFVEFRLVSAIDSRPLFFLSFFSMVFIGKELSVDRGALRLNSINLGVLLQQLRTLLSLEVVERTGFFGE